MQFLLASLQNVPKHDWGVGTEVDLRTTKVVRLVLFRALHLARRGASRDGTRQTLLTDIDALIELGGVVFRVTLRDAGALSVGVLRLGLLGA